MVTGQRHDPSEATLTPEQVVDLCEEIRAENGYYTVVPIGLEEYAVIHRFMFTWAILRGTLLTPGWYDDRWCFSTLGEALAALAEWSNREFEGEPMGWHRHPTTGRRRPEGDASREYVSR